MPDSIWRRVHVADKVLCLRLHNLTGWDKTHQVWNFGKRRKFEDYWKRGTRRSARTGDIEDYCEVSEARDRVGDGIVETAHVCAYDLGYLVRQIPASFPIGRGHVGMLSLESDGTSGWVARYTAGAALPVIVDATPEDALARLAIGLAETRLLRETAKASAI